MANAINNNMAYIPKIKVQHCSPWYARMRVSIDLAILGIKLKRAKNKQAAND